MVGGVAFVGTVEVNVDPRFADSGHQNSLGVFVKVNGRGVGRGGPSSAAVDREFREHVEEAVNVKGAVGQIADRRHAPRIQLDVFANRKNRLALSR